jgi:FAD/FMN-containing dehydrogenase
MEGYVRRRFLAASATAFGAFFLTKTSAIAQGVGLLQSKHAAAKSAAINWDVLRKSVKGPVVTSTAPDFAAVRSAMVWNGIKPDRSPDVIVSVTDDDDVVQAVNFARDNGLKVVVHGGGHTWCGLAVRNGGMTIDLSQLTESKIDKVSAKAVMQPIISNRDAARRLGEHGLAFPLGHCPTVKSSGYLLNGGMSWNMGHWGPACFSVEAIEFVTAGGKKVTASAAEHPDLFWAARGCGPGMFAVATRFHLKCYPLPKAMMSSVYYYSLDDLKEAVRDAVDIGWHKMPETVELSIFLLQAPPELEDKCKKHNGMACMISAVAFADTKEQGEAALASLERAPSIAKCLSKTVNQDATFEKLFDASGATWPENHRNLCENQGSNADPVEVLMALRDKFIQAPSPKSVVVFCQATGGHNIVRTTKDVALSMDARFYGGIWSIWENAEDDAANKKWHDEIAGILQPYTSRHYVGETDIAKDHWRARKSFSPEKWKRLEKIRAKYDPTGLFFGFTGGLNA